MQMIDTNDTKYVEVFNEYVLWKLKMLKAIKGSMPTDFSSFEEWYQENKINENKQKPKIKEKAKKV